MSSSNTTFLWLSISSSSDVNSHRKVESFVGIPSVSSVYFIIYNTLCILKHALQLRTSSYILFWLLRSNSFTFLKGTHLLGLHLVIIEPRLQYKCGWRCCVKESLSCIKHKWKKLCHNFGRGFNAKEGCSCSQHSVIRRRAKAMLIQVSPLEI